jgi:hypothetical protein
MEYRSKDSSDPWHFVETCPDWPDDKPDIDHWFKNSSPPDNLLCQECRRLEAQCLIDASVEALAPKPGQFEPVKFSEIENKFKLHKPNTLHDT